MSSGREGFREEVRLSHALRWSGFQEERGTQVEEQVRPKAGQLEEVCWGGGGRRLSVWGR